MEEKAVLLEIQGSIATITMNRPKAMNSFNQDFVDDFMAALQEVNKDKTVRVVVLTGNGKAFSAGGDLNHILGLEDTVEARDFIVEAGALVTTMMNMEKPFIAMVNGVAAGAGFNLALACDIVYCAETTRFGQSFVNVGLVPDCGGLYLLPRAVGLHKAKELMFTAELINADKALSLGVVNQVFPAEELKDATYKFAQKLAESAPVALGLMKKALNRTYDLSVENMTELEADLQTICMKTEDHQEGVQAFKEKRKPEFQGR